MVKILYFEKFIEGFNFQWFTRFFIFNDIIKTLPIFWSYGESLIQKKIMFYMKTLTCLASREVYYLCFKSRNNLFTAFTTTVCVTDTKVLKEDLFLLVGKTIVVFVEPTHTILIKHDSFKLEEFYLNILKDLAEILSVAQTACFWNNEVYYRYKNWQ